MSLPQLVHVLWGSVWSALLYQEMPHLIKQIRLRSYSSQLLCFRHRFSAPYSDASSVRGVCRPVARLAAKGGSRVRCGRGCSHRQGEPAAPAVPASIAGAVNTVLLCVSITLGTKSGRCSPVCNSAGKVQQVAARLHGPFAPASNRPLMPRRRWLRCSRSSASG